MDASVGNVKGGKRGGEFGGGSRVETDEKHTGAEYSDPPKQELRCLVHAAFAARRAYSLPARLSKASR